MLKVTNELPPDEAEQLLANRATLRQVLNDIKTLYKSNINHEALNGHAIALSDYEVAVLDTWLQLGQTLIDELEQEVEQ